MAIARITTLPSKTKSHIYLDRDIHKKNKRNTIYIKILAILLVISVCCNIIQYLK